MRVFVTGASGFVGSAVVRELLAAGHQVLALARSDTSAAVITAAGAEVQRGALDDLDSLRRGAASADAVIHTAFIHDFTNYGHSAAVDQTAIETIGDVLLGSERPFIVTSGTAGLASGRLVTEEDPSWSGSPRFSEQAALGLASRGVRVWVMRLPPSVHGEGDRGFVPGLISIARAQGVSAYPGDGSNRWAAVYRRDAARLYRLVLEGGPTSPRLHAVGDEGVPTRDIAAVIGRRLNLPIVSIPVEQAGDHFGWLGAFFAMDMPASSALTQQQLRWQPLGPSLLADLDQDHYFAREA